MLNKRKKTLIVSIVVLSCIIAVSAFFTIYGTSGEIPVLLGLKNGKSGVELSWGKCKGAQTYEIYRNAGEKAVLIGESSADEALYCDETAKSGHTYTYYIKAVYKRDSQVSAGKSIYYLRMPVIKSVESEIGGIRVTWGKCGGAKIYKVYKKASSGGYKLKSTQSENTYFDTGKTNGKKANYYIVALNGEKKSARSDLKGTMYITAPRIKSLKNGDGYVKLTWNRITGAKGYYLYRRADDGKSKFKRIGSVSGERTLSFNDTSAPHGKACLYTVRAYNGKYESGYYASGARNIYLKGVTTVGGKYANGKVTLKWKAQEASSGYIIFRKAADGEYQTLANIEKKDTSSYTDKTVKKGKRYQYAICSYKGTYRSTKKSFGKINMIDASKPMVALTFDDGPNGSVTDRILDILEKYGARATFFVVGDRTGWSDSTACIKRAYSMGCEIGNHTYSHQTLTYSSVDVRGQLSKTSSAVKKITGKATPVMRPPGGSYSSRVKELCDYPMILWSVDTRDWESRNADSVLWHIKNETYDGSIVLMHDLYSSTADAVEQAVPWLISKGYQLVTVSEMMEAKGIELQKGEVYFAAD